MARQTGYRWAWLLGLLLLGSLSACRGATATPVVAAHWTETAGATSRAPSPSPALPAPGPTARQTPAASGPMPPPPTAPTVELPFPALIYTLDFGVPAGNSYSPGAMAVHPRLDRLYIATLGRGSYGHRRGQVTVLDLGSGEVLSVAKTGASELSPRALVIDALRDRVYAQNDVDNTCTVLDASSLEPVATIGDVRGFALDQEGGRLYVASSAGLRVLDIAGYRLLREVAVGFSAPVVNMAVDPTRDRVYVAHLEGSEQVLAQYDANTLQRVATTPCPAGCRAAVPDPARGRVALAVGDNADSLWVVDGQGERAEGQPVGKRGPYSALALDSAGDRLFAAREPWPNPGVAVIDLKTGEQVGEIPVTSGVSGLAWDAERSRLWLSLGDRIGVVDPDAGRVVATYPLAIDLDTAEPVLEGSRLYLTDSSGKLRILDTKTYRELATLPVSGDLTLDAPRNRLYVTSWSSPEGSMAVVDTDALTVTKVLTPGGSVGWDPTRNRLYVGRLDQGGLLYNGLTLERLGEMPVGGKAIYNPLRDELLLIAHTVYRVDAETLGFIADLLPDIGTQECPQCEGVPYASDAQVLPDQNLLEITISNAGKGGACGPTRRFFDATTLEPIVDPVSVRAEATCRAQRAQSAPTQGRVYRGLWCGMGESYRNLFVYDLQGKLLTWRDGLDAGVVNPNTCQSYLFWDEVVRVLDLPTLTPVGYLPKAEYTLDAAAGRLYGVSGSQVRVYAEAGGRPDPPPAPDEAGALPAEKVVWLGSSPDFGHDRTLFAGLTGDSTETVHPDKVYRSTDGGATWVRLRGGLPEGDYVGLSLAISPGFAADETLFAGGYRQTWGEGVLRSNDGGDTWQPMWDGLAHLAVQSLAVSPDYVSDGTLLAYSSVHSLLRPNESGASVSRSEDRGLHWTLVATGTVPLPEELLPIDRRSPGLQFRAGYWGGVDRWTADVGSWQPVLRFPPAGRPVRAVLSSRDVGSDNTVYVLTLGGLLRSTDRGDSWSHCPEASLDGRDSTQEPTTATWAGDQIAIGTANGELLLVDPARASCEPIETVRLWPAVLSGSRVGAIAAEPMGRSGPASGGGVWLGVPGFRRLYRYAEGAVQAYYTAADGLPGGSLTGLALAADGVLWMSGTGAPGVASFDGKRWTLHPVPVPEAGGWVKGLAAGPDGTVLAISNPPGVYRWTGKAWEMLGDPLGRLGEEIAGVAVAPDGSPWVATTRGLARYVRGAWTAYDLGECVAVAVGQGGEVYGLTAAGLVWRLAEGVWTTLPSAGPEFVGPSMLYAAHDGALWVGTARGAFRYDGQAWRQLPSDSGLPGDEVEAIAEDGSAGLWFGTNNGAAHVDVAELDLSPVSWPQPVPVPLPTSAPSPTPWPSATPRPVLEVSHVAERFAPAYADAWIAARLRRPREEASRTEAALQRFEKGLMIWRADFKAITVLYDDGRSANYNDTWDESQPVDDPARVPPPGLLQPVRGFGKLWRAEAGLASKLGWALAPEQSYEMVVQAFEGGTMLLGPEGEVYVLPMLGTWQRRQGDL